MTAFAPKPPSDTIAPVQLGMTGKIANSTLAMFNRALTRVFVLRLEMILLANVLRNTVVN